MKNKGTVLKLYKKTAVIMVENCEFIMIKRRPDLFVGKQVSFDESERINPKRNVYRYTTAITVGIAACFILMISYFNIFFNDSIYGYVDLDINPSIGLSINKDSRIIEATPINDDGKVLLDKLKLRTEEASDSIPEIYLAYENDSRPGSGRNNTLLIAACLDEETELYKENREREEEKLNGFLETYMYAFYKQRPRGVFLLTMQVEPELRKRALENGISMGRQALLEKAVEKGNEIGIEDVKVMSISELLEIAEIETRPPSDNETSLTPEPTHTPTFRPTLMPGITPSPKPIHTPTFRPTLVPGTTSSPEPIHTPTIRPTLSPGPTSTPTLTPTIRPTLSPGPTSTPTLTPTIRPTLSPEPTATPR